MTLAVWFLWNASKLLSLSWFWDAILVRCVLFELFHLYALMFLSLCEDSSRKHADLISQCTNIYSFPQFLFVFWILFVVFGETDLRSSFYLRFGEHFHHYQTESADCAHVCSFFLLLLFWITRSRFVWHCPGLQTELTQQLKHDSVLLSFKSESLLCITAADCFLCTEVHGHSSISSGPAFFYRTPVSSLFPLCLHMEGVWKHFPPQTV